MNKNIIYAILPIMISSAFAQNIEKDFKASAKIESFCKIETNNVNFGVLTAPLTTQNASGEMTVLCSNNTPYEIDLSYGGVYGAGGEDTGYTIGLFQSITEVAQYRVYNSTGGLVGYLGCGRGIRMGQVNFSTVALASFYGYSDYNSPGKGYVPDTNNTCVSDGTRDGTYPTGWVGAYNAPRQALYSKGYSYGIMTGFANGDNVAYKITLPNDSTKVWNKGAAKHSSIGTGIVEKININAQVVPASSTSLYPAQDAYQDTVTATIIY